MLNRIKVVTSLVLILALFSVIQFISSGLFFNSLKTDRDIFRDTRILNEQRSELDSTWTYLLQARNTLNRAGSRLALNQNGQSADSAIAKELIDLAKKQLQTANEHFREYENIPYSPKQGVMIQAAVKADYDTLNGALNELVLFITTDRLQAFLDQPTQSYQDKFEKTYLTYRDSYNAIYKDAIDENESAYASALWILSSIVVFVLVMSGLVWLGVNRALIQPLNKIVENIRYMAKGDLTHRLEFQGTNEMGILADSLRHMQSEFISTVSAVRQGAEAIYTGSSEISAGNNDLSSRTEQQAASLEETAASMEQLTATVKQNAENARQASQLALSASETAQKGGQVVDNVVKTMHDIAGSSQKISDITSVIDGIAFQTNILALNAAVEAARAGEQGRGFAVVAGEVRNLAQRSAQAAKEIKTLIDDSVGRVDEGSKLVETAGETMGEIVGAVTRVTDIMGEIASASDEQSKGIDQVGQAVTEMDRVTQQNAALVEESASAAVALEEQVRGLNHSVSLFRLPDEGNAFRPAIAPAAAKTALLSQTAEKPSGKKNGVAVSESSDNWEKF
ncbi:methyl-accepting chemotaxis protein [Lonsdalea quercina]|uniref:Methyl-accepting chemotaxis sensory transducer with TarH sensor n=1 Tax=Lonsdalea quercina TaxID=71657 RepID=A0A1H3VL28_9GAMM|nr:methyl-accepting chemotaxis protein [Lonsdalea quercina]SDZ74812.1 methyl-accepting chemotaxis sensory transducer with TarH sensor [Lonsdalea quercina]